MLAAIDLGTLDMYRELIERYHATYGPQVWHLLYQCDVRARLELADDVRHRLLLEHEDAVSASLVILS